MTCAVADGYLTKPASHTEDEDNSGEGNDDDGDSLHRR
jgi:hypothetical protein